MSIQHRAQLGPSWIGVKTQGSSAGEQEVSIDIRIGKLSWWALIIDKIVVQWKWVKSRARNFFR